MSNKIELLKEIIADLIKDTLDNSIDNNQTLNAIQPIDWGKYLEEHGIDLNLIDQTFILAVIAGVAYTVDRLYKD